MSNCILRQLQRYFIVARNHFLKNIISYLYYIIKNINTLERGRNFENAYVAQTHISVLIQLSVNRLAIN